MIDRVAVLADVHCVLPALEAVLAEPGVRAADLIVLAGDVAVGPQPEQTFEVLTALGDRVVWVSVSDPNLMLAAWGAARLRAEHIELLVGLPATVTLGVRG